MLSEQETKQIKEQFFKQLENLPEEQRELIKAEIQAMTPEQLEEFLKKNNMMQSQGENQNPFRMIAEGKLPSYKIAETEQALAVLEINPVSKGHTIIIQKVPAKTISENIKKFAEQIGELLKHKLKCEKTEVSEAEILGEKIINIIPLYKNQQILDKREKASEEDLKKIQEEILAISIEEKQEPTKPKKPRKIPLKRLPKAPVRMP